MAGGESDPRAADRNIADAIKALLVSRVIGAENEAWLRGVRTDARHGWQALLGTLRSAEQHYLSPTFGFGLGPRRFITGLGLCL